MVQPGEIVAEKSLAFVGQDVKEAVLVVNILNITNPINIVQIYFLSGRDINEECVCGCTDDAGGLSFVKYKELGLLLKICLEIIEVFLPFSIEVEFDYLIPRHQYQLKTIHHIKIQLLAKAGHIVLDQVDVQDVVDRAGACV